MFRILATMAALLLVGAAAPAPIGLVDLYQASRFGEVQLSPDGTKIAMVRRGERDMLVVLDIVARKQVVVYRDIGVDVLDINWVRWKGNDRLVLNASAAVLRRSGSGLTETTRFRGANVGIAEQAGWRIFAVDAAGTSLKDLGQGLLLDGLDKDPGHILVIGDHQHYASALYRIDVVSGEKALVEKGMPETFGWETDSNGTPVVRYDVLGYRGGVKVMGQAPGTSGWKQLFVVRPKDFEALPDLEILAAAGGPGKLYVAVKPEKGAGDTRELRLFDFATRTMGPKLWSQAKYDLADVIIDRNGRLEAECYWADVYTCDYVDAEQQAEFKALSAFFEDQASIQTVSQSADGSKRILLVSGPEDAGTLYLYDRATRKVVTLGSIKPSLRPEWLGMVDLYSYKASDGFSLSAYLTAPRFVPPGPLPLIVMPHGGPEARDHFDYDPWAQMFATRGYLVFQPQFRGSGGLGLAMAEAGYGQWGGRMQDDVIDGVKALIAAGKVDPKRICIVGASYGGYVALQAGAKNPELFKCVVSRAGVADLIASQTAERKAGGADSPRYQYWLKSIGDPESDRARLIAASPVTYAKTYGPPVLLLHGEDDDIVPLEQSQIMNKALTGVGRGVKLLTYPNEGHSYWSTADSVASGQETLAFVAAAIGPGGP